MKRASESYETVKKNARKLSLVPDTIPFRNHSRVLSGVPHPSGKFRTVCTITVTAQRSALRFER